MANGSRGHALVAFMVKEMRHLLRDRQTLAILLLLPLAQVILFGFALRTDVNEIRLAIVDPTPDAQTLAIRGRFAGNGRFRLLDAARSLDAVEPDFRQSAADVAIVFPPNFSDQLASGVPTRIEVVSDASDPNAGTTMQSYVSAVIASWQADLSVASGGVQIVPQVRMRFNPSLQSVNLFVPGLIALVVMMVSALMTAISLSREMERGSLEILLVSPLHPWQIIVGKVVPYLVLAFANVATALLSAWVVFHVPFRGSLLLLLGASTLYALVGLALGVLIAALTTSQRAAMMAAMLGTMLPTVMLSGMVFPVASMPVPLQLLSRIIPARWFVVVVRGIMLKGAGLAELWQELAILTVILLVLLVAATRSFKTRLA